MDVKRIKYAQTLIQNKIRLEKEIDMLNSLIDENMEDCVHLEVKVTDGPNNSSRCLFCGKKLPFKEDSLLTVDACTYKEEKYHKGFAEAEKLARLNDLREFAIACLLVTPNLTREELIVELNKELETKGKEKIKEKKD